MTFDIPKVKLERRALFYNTDSMFIGFKHNQGKLQKPMLPCHIFDEEKDSSLRGWGQDIMFFKDISNEVPGKKGLKGTWMVKETL